MLRIALEMTFQQNKIVCNSHKSLFQAQPIVLVHCCFNCDKVHFSFIEELMALLEVATRCSLEILCHSLQYQPIKNQLFTQLTIGTL